VTGQERQGSSRRALFRPRTAAFLTWGILGLLMVSLFFLIFAEPVPDVEPGQPDSFSHSAIGYRALLRLLQQEGSETVLVSRRNSATKVSERVPLVLLEPRSSPEGLEQLRDLIARANARRAPVVLVLPKWRGRPGTDPRGWIEEALPLPPATPSRVLAVALDCSLVGCDEAAGGDPAAEPKAERGAGSETAPTYGLAAEISRPDTLGTWRSSLPGTGELGTPALVSPQLAVLNSDPDSRPESQRTRWVEILLETPEGALLFYVPDLRLHVVTDPDLLNTSGLARGDNALYAHRLLVDRLQPTSFVVAEEIHGYAIAPSIWRALLRPPLVLVTVHLAAFAVLVLWAGTGRFGSPLPAPPRVAPGKGTLIENTALLLGQGGHFGESVDRYLQWTVRRAERRFNPYGDGIAGARPQGLLRQVARLSRLGERRGVGVDLERVARGAVTLAGRGRDPRRALELARQLYRWRKEMEDG